MKEFIASTKKSSNLGQILNEALTILASVGIPLEGLSQRRLEKIAMSFLAVAGVISDWRSARSESDGKFLQTRKVIEFINQHFEDDISPGSYDDIRRKDLKLPVLAGIIVNSGGKKGLATNDATRGYALSDDFAELVRSFGTVEWDRKLDDFKSRNADLSKELGRKRVIGQIPVLLPNGQSLKLSVGEHNQLQKAIIEEFLPRFGYGAEVIYVGDTTNKTLVKDEKRLEELGFFELNHDKLPDIVAFSKAKGWLYLIEAVHSSGPLNEVRLMELKQNLRRCKLPLVFVTAFLSKSEFRKWAAEIGWETEVWIADNPDHMIHFNGDKFLGPYINPS